METLEEFKRRYNAEIKQDAAEQNDFRAKSDDELAKQNQELKISLKFDHVEVGDAFYDTLFHDMWVVTKISVNFDDLFRGTPVVCIELTNSKRNRNKKSLQFPSASNVMSLTSFKKIEKK